MEHNNIKQNFTAGEVSDLMYSRSDFERFRNGCREATNMVVKTQGPITRRSGTRYVASLNGLGIDLEDPQIRLIPFIFNRIQAYVIVFFKHESGSSRCVFMTDDGVVAYPDPPPTECPSGDPISVNAGDIVYVDMPAGWSIADFDYAQTGDELYTAQPDLYPHILKRYDDYCWVVTNIETALTNPPADWSDVYGYPETVGFFQQRLLFGGNKLRRQTIWTSRAGDFNHFGNLGASIVDADAITFTLDSGSQNQISWMQTVRSLHVGTIDNEWVVNGNQQTSIVPGGVVSESHTNNGSEKIKPLRVGLTTLFVERHGRVVNEFVYDYTYDSFKTTDVTVLAPHLTNKYSITSWAYQQTPNSVVWVVREDGTLLGLTYQRQHNVVAWHVHKTAGDFIDVCTIPGNNRETDVWFAVHRYINGTDVYYIEKKAEEFNSNSSVDSKFLDCHVYQQDVEPTLTVDNLEHLEGEIVEILADGMHLPPQVVSGGQITLPFEATNKLVGLSFRSVVNPLLIPYSDDMGYTEGRFSRVFNLALRLKDTSIFSIGKYNPDGSEHVEEVSTRQPWMPQMQALPLFSGIRFIEGIEGYSRDPQFWIEQSNPLPLTILGIIYSAEVN